MVDRRSNTGKTQSFSLLKSGARVFFGAILKSIDLASLRRTLISLLSLLNKEKEGSNLCRTEGGFYIIPARATRIVCPLFF
jgi:hypothetical protein